MNNYTFKIISTDGTENEVMIKSRSTTLNINMLKKVKNALPEGALSGTLYIPEGIQIIDNMALTGICGKMKTIILPSTVEKIYRHAFYFPLCVEKIIVSNDNPYFLSGDDGVLFNKDKTVLVRYPIGKLDDCYEIPPAVTEIAPFAFAQTKVKFLIVPKSVSTVGEQAFQYSELISADFSETKIESLPKECFWFCNNLITVKLPKHLKSIGTKCFCQCAFECIKLPDTLIKIEKHAFLSSKIKTISIPRDVKNITKGTFQDCRQLETININNVTKVHKTAFADCSALLSINVNVHNRLFSASNGILYNKNFTKLLKVPPSHRFDDGKFKISDTITSIDEAAFDSCVNLVELDIGDATLEDSAIFNCPNLKKIIIGADCKEFSPEKIKLCFALEEIIVDPDSPYYKSVDGILFDKSGEKLIFYPSARADKLYTVPDGTTEISDFAIYNAYNITEVRVPETVNYIRDNAFEHCSNLTKINLSKVAVIGHSAFGGCEKLDNISLSNDTCIEDYAFSFCSALNCVKQGKNLKVCNNSFMLTPFNDYRVDFTANEEELSRAFISANTPVDFLLFPRYYQNNFWGK